MQRATQLRCVRPHARLRLTFECKHSLEHHKYLAICGCRFRKVSPPQPFSSNCPTAIVHMESLSSNEVRQSSLGSVNRTKPQAQIDLPLFVFSRKNIWTHLKDRF